jgi:hypothetical protein
LKAYRNLQRKTSSVSKMSEDEPEEISGSMRLTSSAASIAEREKLAKTLEKLFDEAFNPYFRKLKELRPMITELRQHFMKLKSGETIAGCGNWTEYCDKVLHRSDRRVRQIMGGANPASEKHSRKSLPAPEEPKAPSQPKTVKMPKIQVSEWTSTTVADTSFSFVNAVFREAKLPDEDQKKALEHLIQRLQELVLGNSLPQIEGTEQKGGKI